MLTRPRLSPCSDLKTQSEQSNTFGHAAPSLQLLPCSRNGLAHGCSPSTEPSDGGHTSDSCLVFHSRPPVRMPHKFFGIKPTLPSTFAPPPIFPIVPRFQLFFRFPFTLRRVHLFISSCCTTFHQSTEFGGTSAQGARALIRSSYKTLRRH